MLNQTRYSPTQRLVATLWACCCLVLASSSVQADESLADRSLADRSTAERFAAADSAGVAATRAGNRLILVLESEVTTVTVPRVAAAIKSLHWQLQDKSSVAVSSEVVKPDPDTWTITCGSMPESGASLVVVFDSPPLLLSELEPITAAGDGSFRLPAHLGATSGEKIRYEPQPFKNTIGYWVGKQDFAEWQIEVSEPGRFNVAVLQGCGAGQGGSLARISAIAESQEVTASLEFTTLETGHFQNFQWRHLGTVELESSGLHKIKVEPVRIQAKAVMDIRAIELIRVPK